MPDVRVLLVEDMPAEAELTIRQLRRAGINNTWRRVDTDQALREALLDFKPDIVLSDFTLPGFDGMGALNTVREVAPELPFVFVSGTIGEERAIEALRRGAVDYVLKTNLARLAPAVNRALDEAATRAARQRQEQQISRLTRVLRMLSGINGLVLRTRDYDELFDEASRLAVSVGQYATAVVMLQRPGTQSLEALSCAGIDSSASEALRSSLTDAAARNSGIIGRILQTGTRFVCNDCGELDQSDSTNALIVASGYGSVVALPLLLDKTAIGALILASSEKNVLIDEELQMLREVADNLSFALQYLQKDSAVRFLSYFDPLTGLAKRSLFCERLDRMLARAPGDSARLAVAVIDVEQLSVINDSFGRHLGDRLLQHVADRLRRHFPDTEWLAQFGGGTFAIVLDAISQAEEPMSALQQRLTEVFGRSFEMEGSEIPVVIKSGLALSPQDGRDADTLVQNAEAALRNARATGQRHQHYSLEQRSEVVARLALEHKLRTALEQRQFELHYQPQVNIETRRIESVEALIRWRHPETGLMSPAAFLPLLESTGLIVNVGQWVAEQAARDCQHWQRLGLPPIRVAINVSPAELRQPDFQQRFLQLTQSWSTDRFALDIEITEGALLDDSVTEINKLKTLRSAGVRISIDDFGTGYSSLSRLSDLPIDTLKIDRTFIMRLPDDSSGRTLVTTMITLAHAFGMTVVAEGVETAEQLQMLCDLGCDQLQGYLLSKPVTADRLLALMQQDKPLAAAAWSSTPCLAP